MTTSVGLRRSALAACAFMGFCQRRLRWRRTASRFGRNVPDTAGAALPGPRMPRRDGHQSGPAMEMKTRRPYFLDYPCDLKPGEKVTFILSLHGGGSYGNWQRHYFPLMDYKDKYRLVIATPNSPTRVWSAVDDRYLQNIVDLVVEQIGKDNIKAFWLVGHSQGGMTLNRIVRTDFFKDRVDGWLSLSGGRLGGNPGRAANFGPARRLRGAARAPAASARSSSGTFRVSRGAAASCRRATSRTSMTTGMREIDDKGIPESSDLGEEVRLRSQGCGGEIADSQAGYVYDWSRLNQPNPALGIAAGARKAQSSVPECKDGRVVADVVRLDKGHTEGLEPKITEELVKLMLVGAGREAAEGVRQSRLTARGCRARSRRASSRHRRNARRRSRTRD